MSKNQELKQQAAEYAVDNFIQSGMLVGLGVGSTAIFAVERLGALIKDGTLTGITAIPCSVAIERAARHAGIPLVDFTPETRIDVTIDGADEVDPQLNLIKGGGGALLREKIVAQASRREVIVVDPSKLSEALGTKWAVPVEVAQFGWQSQIGFLESIGGKPALRRDADRYPYATDQGNYIIDASFGPIENPSELEHTLKMRTGVVEVGLFIDLATDLVIASPEGIEVRTR